MLQYEVTLFNRKWLKDPRFVKWWYNRRIGFTDPLPFDFVPQFFFFGTNLPKTGRVLTLTKTGLNSNRNGS